MKKLLATALLSTVVATPVFAADSGYGYAGITVGRAKTKNPYLGTVTKDTDTAAPSLLGGYQFTKNWGAEAFLFTGAGKMEITSPVGVRSSINGAAFGVNGVGTIPINDNFSVYAKLGYAFIKTEVNPGTAAVGDKRNTITGGLGGQYNVNKEVGIRLGWDRYELSTNGGQQKPETDVWSVGGIMKF